jgi:Ca2+-binding EF-hand superfamily protein
LINNISNKIKLMKLSELQIIEIKKVFKNLDQDGDGELSFEETHKIIDSMNQFKVIEKGVTKF